MPKAATFVLVHGAWHGGWCWRRVADRLQAAGSRVFAPTLTGLGERGHLRDPIPGLATHVEDVCQLIEVEELHDIILVGHSLGGMVISVVADHLKNRIARLVYLDAAVPADGEDFASHIPGIVESEAERRRTVFRGMAPDGAWLPAPPPQMVGVLNPDDQSWLQRRLTPQPLSTWLEPVRYQNGGPAGLPKTYVLATQPLTTLMGYPVHGEVAKCGGEWTYREIACGHDMMVVEPVLTVDLLLEAAGMDQ